MSFDFQAVAGVAVAVAVDGTVEDHREAGTMEADNK